jgi:hypothetical protein
MITELRITAPPDTLPARSAGQPYGRGTLPRGRLCEPVPRLAGLEAEQSGGGAS